MVTWNCLEYYFQLQNQCHMVAIYCFSNTIEWQSSTLMYRTPTIKYKREEENLKPELFIVFPWDSFNKC